MTNLHFLKILNEKLLGKKVKFQYTIQNYYTYSDVTYEEAKEISGGFLIDNKKNKYSHQKLLAKHTVFKVGEIVEILIKGYEVELKLIFDGKYTRKVYFGMDEELVALDDNTYIITY